MKMGRGCLVRAMMIAAVLFGSEACSKPKSSAGTTADKQKPIEVPLDRNAIAKTHVDLRSAPNADPKLAYQIGVPATWAYSKAAATAVKDGVPRGLGGFAASDASGAPSISVTVAHFSFEIPIDASVKLALTRQGYQILRATYFPGPHGLFFDATGVRVAGDRQEVARITARAEGSNVFWVNTVSDRQDWDAVKDVFWLAHLSFNLVEGSGDTRMEPWKFAYGDNPDFQTSYPASWASEKVKQPSKDISAVDIRLRNPAGNVVLGYVQVRARRGDEGRPALDLAALRDDSLAKLKKSLGYVPSRPFQPLTLDDDPRSEVAKGWLGGFSGEEKLGEDDVAVRLGYLRRGDLTFSIIALSAPVRDDTLAALRTQRAFEIARDTLQLPD